MVIKAKRIVLGSCTRLDLLGKWLCVISLKHSKHWLDLILISHGHSMTQHRPSRMHKAYFSWCKNLREKIMRSECETCICDENHSCAHAFPWSKTIFHLHDKKQPLYPKMTHTTLRWEHGQLLVSRRGAWNHKLTNKWPRTIEHRIQDRLWNFHASQSFGRWL